MLANLNWNREDSIAGLWAYATTSGGPVSRKLGSPVAEVALKIGRAVGGVYNKVMNFRALDPRDTRTGLSSGAEVDRQVWSEFWNEHSVDLDHDRLERAYRDSFADQGWERPRVRRANQESTISEPTEGARQGYAVDPKLCKAVELRATMHVATRFYEKLGYQVRDTSRHRPYDLVCTRDETSFRVEVKGSTTSLQSINVTRGEVESAREQPTELFVVHSIEVDREAKTANGGKHQRFERWEPADDDLTALAYDCVLPRQKKK